MNMRVTNFTETNRTMMNINGNKEYLDRLNTQMSTEKKISRPSDDPIIAIKALRLRSDLSEVIQYFGANVPDAQAWVSVTQKAIDSSSEMLSGMRSLCNQGANGTNTTSEREKIYQELEGLKNQIYLNGNATNAGRTVFTGCRTGEKLTFIDDIELRYKDISDGFNAKDVVEDSYVHSPLTMSSINSLTDNNETEVRENRVMRLRLSYDNLDELTKGSKTGETIEFGNENPALLPDDKNIQIDIDSDNNTFDMTFHYKNYEGSTLKTYEIKLEDVPLSVLDGGEYSGGKIDGTDAPGGRLKVYSDGTVEYSYDASYGRVAIRGSKDADSKYEVTTVGTNTTKSVDVGNLKYRTPLENEPAISDMKKDPQTGVVQSLVIDKKGDGSSLMTLAPTGGFLPEKEYEFTDGKVTVHTDGSMTFRNYHEPATVYNISASGKTITSAYSEHSVKLTVTDSTTEIDTSTHSTVYDIMRLNDKGETEISGNAGKAYLLRDTGEIILGSDLAKTLGSLKDIKGADSISVVYDKTKFDQGDLRPEHYFDCKLDVNADGSVNRNDDIIYDTHNQEIVYTVGTNQTIRINTFADQVFDTQIARELDDVLDAITGYNEAEEKVNKLKAMQEDTITYNDMDQQKISKLLDAANKELETAKNKLQRKYEEGITAFKDFQEQADLAGTDCGTTDNRLALISNRLMEQKATVTTMASDNENVDITNVAVEVKEAELVYNAALMATGKINQRSLVDYI